MSEITIHYVWLDEDNEEVSPRHRKFGSALNFITGWQQRWERAINDSPWQREKLSKTGKPPVKLMRLMTTVELVVLSDSEKTVLDVVLEDKKSS